MPKSKKIQSSDLFFWAAVFFIVIFFIAGFSHGYSVSRSRNYLEPFIVNNLRVNSDSEGYYLNYQCRDAPYRYYVDADRVETDVQALEEVKASGSGMGLLFEDGTITKAFIGGAAVWGTKDIFQYVAGAEGKGSTYKRIGDVVVVVVLAAAGYGVGYWLALKLNGNPDCGSREIKSLLGDKAEWRRLNRFAWEMAFNNVSVGLANYFKYRLGDVERQKAQDAILNQAILKVEQVRKRASDVNHVFVTDDYKALEAIAEMRSSFIKTYEQYKAQGNQSAAGAAVNP